MIAIDVETTGVNWHKDRVFGVAMKVMSEEDFENIYGDLL